MPAVPPYSSTTIARCWPAERISDRAGSTRLVAGKSATSRDRSPTRVVRGATSGSKQVAHVDEADDLVGGAAHDRVARVRLVAALAHGLVDVHGRVEEVDLGARQHHLAQLPVTDVEDVLDDPSLLGAERLVASMTMLRSSSAEISSRPSGRVAAEQPDDDVGGAREQPDHRTHDPCDEVDDRRHGEGDALGALQRQALRRELAEHEGEERDHHGDRHQGQGSGHRLRHAPADEDRLEAVGEGRGAEGG